jgi:hypothetical protein
MEWIQDNPIVALIGLVASLIGIGAFAVQACKWLSEYRTVRVNGEKRDCRYCNGTGKVFYGTRIGSISNGVNKPCQICGGKGIVQD